MSTSPEQRAEVAVIGAGVVGCAVAVALARRGARVAVLEAEPEPGLGASGTNSGILHTGFDATPGELETEMLLASGAVRDAVLTQLGIPVLRCGALMRPVDDSQRGAVAAEAEIARRNGVRVVTRDDGALEVPGESVTDPVAYTLALAAEAGRQGAELRTRFRVAAIDRDRTSLTVRAEDGGALGCRVAVNCAGLEADSVARLAGDDSFLVYPRKGEFLVFDPPESEPLDRILLPVPTKRTRGVLVFPTVDGKVIAGPTAVDLEDKHDWSVRPDARDEIMPKAIAIYPPLEHAEPIAAYAGLRPAGRGVNYAIGPSRACPGLVNVAAIRSTGLSASLGIGTRVAEIVGSLGVALGPERELLGGEPPWFDRPWWRRTAKYRAVAA
ncbi:MAG TPA: FAD-dependent oxidoreductase [Solirubrobacteraceae bacterium]|nr:FAD-dependent oxidoreductase [Solirubrobacteraceae bacterium]